MPTVGPFHGFYWAGDASTAVTPVIPGEGRSGYPSWQAAVIAPSLFGLIGAWLDARLALLRWWLAFGRRVHRLDRERRAVLLVTLARLESPAYPLARLAVRQTATTLGFNRPEAWQPYARELKASPGRAENTFRHLRAYTLLDQSVRAKGSTLSHPDLHLTTELAYRGFAEMGR